MIGLTELIIIVVVAIVILGGGKKIEEIARALGRFSVEFKKGKIEAEKELMEFKDEVERKNQQK